MAVNFGDLTWHTKWRILRWLRSRSPMEDLELLFLEHVETKTVSIPTAAIQSKLQDIAPTKIKGCVVDSPSLIGTLSRLADEGWVREGKTLEKDEIFWQGTSKTSERIRELRRPVWLPMAWQIISTLLVSFGAAVGALLGARWAGA